MPAKLYVIHGSHPCAVVEQALRMKGLAFKRVELAPPMHMPLMRMRFGERTVPGLRLEDGEKVQGSRRIVRRLDELVPEPALLPAERRAEIEEAERWGDEVYQPIPRRLLWPAFQRHPRSMYEYQEGQQMPKMPAPVLTALAPMVTRVECRANQADEPTIRRNLRELPGHLDRIDRWLADGLLGGEQANAADLQIAATTRLLMTIGDVRPLLEGRPAAEHAHRWFEPMPARTPPGILPAEWLAEARPAATVG